MVLPAHSGRTTCKKTIQGGPGCIASLPGLEEMLKVGGEGAVGGKDRSHLQAVDPAELKELGGSGLIAGLGLIAPHRRSAEKARGTILTAPVSDGSPLLRGWHRSAITIWLSMAVIAVRAYRPIL